MPTPHSFGNMSPDHPTSVIPTTRQIHRIALTIISTSRIILILTEIKNMVSAEKTQTYLKIPPAYEHHLFKSTDSNKPQNVIFLALALQFVLH